MDEPIIVGIDIGTSKICTLVARVENESDLRILGVGIEPSQGLRKGVVVDLHAASLAVQHSVEKAERTSGFEINAALVSLAGSHVSAVNSRGVVGISGGVVDLDDIDPRPGCSSGRCHPAQPRDRARHSTQFHH